MNSVLIGGHARHIGSMPPVIGYRNYYQSQAKPISIRTRFGESWFQIVAGSALQTVRIRLQRRYSGVLLWLVLL